MTTTIADVPDGCGFGPCRNSRDRGGDGCYLCDVVAHLPQPRDVTDDRRTRAAARRDGVAGVKGGQSLAFKKRYRVGPHR
jgi:hypothetical protein